MMLRGGVVETMMDLEISLCLRHVHQDTWWFESELQWPQVTTSLLSMTSNNELDLASLTFWTRLHVIHWDWPLVVCFLFKVVLNNNIGQGRAREEWQGLKTRHVSSPRYVSFPSFLIFLSTKLLFTFRTTTMMTNSHTTTSTHLNTVWPSLFDILSLVHNRFVEINIRPWKTSGAVYWRSLIARKS